MTVASWKQQIVSLIHSEEAEGGGKWREGGLAGQTGGAASAFNCLKCSRCQSDHQRAAHTLGGEGEHEEEEEEHHQNI